MEDPRTFVLQSLLLGLKTTYLIHVDTRVQTQIHTSGSGQHGLYLLEPQNSQSTVTGVSQK